MEPPKFKKENSSLKIIKELLEEKCYIAPEKKISLQEDDHCLNDRARRRLDKAEDFHVESVQLCPSSPITLRHDEVMGRCLVAARDILPGETFLNDWPIVEAPNAEEKTGGGASSSTCLGCCAIISTDADPHKCPRCGWPVCSDACSNIPQHAQFECKVFAKERIKPKLILPA